MCPFICLLCLFTLVKALEVIKFQTFVLIFQIKSSISLSCVGLFQIVQLIRVYWRNDCLFLPVTQWTTSSGIQRWRPSIQLTCLSVLLRIVSNLDGSFLQKLRHLPGNSDPKASVSFYNDCQAVNLIFWNIYYLFKRVFCIFYHYKMYYKNDDVRYNKCCLVCLYWVNHLWGIL